MTRARPWTLAVLCLAACARPPERPNLLLITVDTLRADHLGCYGYERGTTPHLDALAAEGLRFSHAQSPRSKTTPAMASLMTGLYPHEHGVRDLASPLAPGVPVLAEALRASGYRTGAIVGNWVLSERLAGLARGFELWVEHLPDVQGVPPDDVPQRTARSLTDGALVALGLTDAPDEAGFEPRAPFVSADRPWLLWLHYMDPHGAYTPPDEHRVLTSAPERLPDPPGPDEPPGEPPHAWYVAEYNVPPEARLEDGGVDVARVRDLYDGEIRYVDAQIGRLLARLREAGRLEDTLVLVTADHGESLGEHRYWFEHGRYAYENTCRVPLIVRPHDALRGRPAPGVRRGDISLCDLAPTLLELLSLPPLAPEAPGLRGGSRLELLRADGPPRAVFCEKVERAELSGVVQSKAVRLGDWKLIRRFAARPLPNPPQRELVLLGEQLFDLAADPDEELNLVGDPPQAAPLEALRAALARFTDADAELVDLDLVLQRRREALERSDPETLRVLRALGY